MDPKFLKLEEAAEQLQIGTDRLNELREQGKLRAYRDGSSWKFRTEEIEQMSAEGVPAAGEESGLSLEESDLSLGESLNEMSLEEDAGSGLVLELEEEEEEPESILLSEAELGESTDRPPSTIIGRADLDMDSDLEIAKEAAAAAEAAELSDVRLADVDEGGLDRGDTGELPVGDSAASFDDIEELEIDLEAESSRILSPEDVAAAQSAATEQQQQAPETSDLKLEEDLELAPSSDIGLSGLSDLGADDPSAISTSEVNLGVDSGTGSDPGLTGLSALELDEGDDDDFVLGDGSDLTLSSADSGINLSPADSGLSLDDAALELTGSAIGSGLDFAEAVGEPSSLIGEPADEGFELTPAAEEPSGEDDDSSQVIALDAFEEQQEADDLLGESAGAAAVSTPAAAGFATTAATPQVEAQFSGWLVSSLAICLLMLSLCGMMVIDVVRSMWSWNEPYAANSSIIDALSGMLGF